MSKIKAQPLILNVWNGKIPGAIESPRFKEDTIRIENGKIRISQSYQSYYNSLFS